MELNTVLLLSMFLSIYATELNEILHVTRTAKDASHDRAAFKILLVGWDIQG